MFVQNNQFISLFNLFGCTTNHSQKCLLTMFERCTFRNLISSTGYLGNSVDDSIKHG